MQWLAGPKGGGWFEMAAGLCRLIAREHPDLHITAVSGGGKENPARIERGEGQLAMSIDFLAAAARAGHEPYDEPMSKVHTIGVGWSALPFHLLVGKGCSRDLRVAITGRSFRIAVPAKNTSDELTFRRVMAYYGSSYDAIRAAGGAMLHGSYDEIIADIKEDRVNYLFGATTKPAAIIASAGDGSRGLRLASMPPDLMDHLSAFFGYGRGTITAGTYPKLHTVDISTTVMETIVLISADVGDAVVYKLLETLLKNPARLAAVDPSLAGFDPSTAWRDLPVPLHPGAARAYHELGFMP